MADIFVGSVSVGVVPDASGWNRTLQRELVPSAEVVGREYGEKMGKSITREMGKSGEDSGGAFSRNFRRRVDAAIKALPKAEIDGDSTKAEKRVQELRRKLEELSKQDIIDQNKAIKDIAAIELELGKLSRSAKDIEVRFDTKVARAQLELLKREVGSTGGGGGIRGLLGLGAAAGGDAAGAGGKAASGLSLTSPYVVAGLVAAVAAASPSIGAAVAGAVVSGFGLGLVAIAAIGAAKAPLVTKAFDNMKSRIMEDFQIIGMSWTDVLESILNTARQVFDAMTPVFSDAAKVIAGPFKVFADTILRAFTQPEVKSSITAVATSFAAILTAMTPDIPKWFTEIANSITAIANTIAEHPEAFTRIVGFLIDVVNFGLRTLVVLTDVSNWIASVWPTIGPLLIGPFEVAADIITGRWGKLYNDIVSIGKSLWSVLSGIWNFLWTNLVVRTIHGHQFIQNEINQFFHGVAHQFDLARHDIAHVWDLTWNAVKGAATTTWNTLRRIFASFIVDGILGPLGTIVHAAAVAFGWVPGIGPKLKTADRQFQEFAQSVNRSLGGINDQTVNVSVRMTAKTNPYPGGISGRAARGLYVNSGTYGVDDQLILAQRGELIVPTGMVNAGAVDHLRGSIPGFAAGGQVGIRVSTPSPTQTGKFLWAETVYLVQSAMKNAGILGAMFGATVANIGSGVARWTGVVLQALAMLGLPTSLLGSILYQMQTESGGNPNAINLWDTNAQHGDPSRGLMQTIGATFTRYHVPGTSWNIYDPLANVAAALNYARANHKFGTGKGQLGSGHGYDAGGWLPPGVTLAYNMTGQPEPVLTPAQWDSISSRARGGDGGPVYHAHFDGLTGAAIESHVQTAFRVMSITQGNLNRQGRRS